MISNKAPTVVDVARLSGMSVTTVSRVLNKSGYYSNSTLKKVEEVIKELDYRPNRSARRLRGKPLKLIGLIIPDITNVFYTAFANAILIILRQRGYDLLLFTTDEDEEKDLAYLQILEEKQVDGVLYIHPAEGRNTSQIRTMVKHGLPIVEVNRQNEKDMLDAVLLDNMRGAQQGVEHLISLGHQLIALIIGSQNITTGQERVLGYRNAIEANRIPFDKDLVKIGSFTRQHGEQATQELLSLDKPPTAILAGSNRIVLGVIETIRQRSLNIPQDLSLVAFDDTEWLNVWNPPITAIQVNIPEMANIAVDLLLRRISAGENGYQPVTVYINTTLVLRESCRKV